MKQNLLEHMIRSEAEARKKENEEIQKAKAERKEVKEKSKVIRRQVKEEKKEAEYKAKAMRRQEKEKDWRRKNKKLCHSFKKSKIRLKKSKVS